MIIPIRSGEWSNWAGSRDEDYFAHLLHGLGWRIAVKNQDFKRIVEGDSKKPDPEHENNTMSMDSVASFWDPCKQRFEAVFIESKRRTNKPSQSDIEEWIMKCRRAQEFVEGSDEIQHKLCAGTGQEDMQCSKSILFLDCDAWKNIRAERLSLRRESMGIKQD